MTRSTTVIKPKQALQSYLDGLLQDAFAEFDETGLDEFAQAVEQERLQDVQRPLVQSPVRELEPVRVLSTVRMPVPEAVVEEAPLVSAELSVEPVEEVATTAVTSETVVSSVSSRPDWSHEAFECLLFDVAGLTLAVPLVSLGSIYPLQGQELTPLFGQPDWYLGLLPSQSGNLRVLDTARWVLADRYRDEYRDNLRYVISVQGFEWGLAVHQVSRSIRLQPDEVKWRSERSQRPWLAGTVIEHMCALLDVQELAQLVAQGGLRR